MNDFTLIIATLTRVFFVLIILALAGKVLIALMRASAKDIKNRLNPNAPNEEITQKAPTPKTICVECGYAGSTVNMTPGSFLIELVLWLCFILPGLIYSLWRINARHAVCNQCGSAHVIPANSPRGQKIRAELS